MVGDPCSYLLGVWILYIGGTFNALRAFREGCGHTLKPLKWSNSTISTPTNFWFSPKISYFSGILSYFLYLTVRDCYLMMFSSPISVWDTSHYMWGWPKGEKSAKTYISNYREKLWFSGMIEWERFLTLNVREMVIFKFFGLKYELLVRP